MSTTAATVNTCQWSSRRGCGRAAKKRGYCSTHYDLLRTRGDLEVRTLVDATPTRELLQAHLGRGSTHHGLARRLSTAHGHIRAVSTGTTKRVTTQFSGRVAALTLRPSNIGCVRRVDSLQALGRTLEAVATFAGLAHSALHNVHRCGRFSDDMAFALALAFDRMPSGVRGPSPISAARARRRGAVLPMAWEGVDIDDPDAKPLGARRTAPSRTRRAPGRAAHTASGQHHGLLAWQPDVLYAYDTGSLRSIREPMPTQTTVEGEAVIQSHLDVDSCLFRMLMPEEIKLGMAFARGFILLGDSSRVKVRMCGNAVTPPVARDLVACVVEAITGEAGPSQKDSSLARAA